MANDIWGRLWDIATIHPKGKAMIELQDDADHVVLIWPDGSKAEMEWFNGDWCFEEFLTEPKGA